MKKIFIATKPFVNEIFHDFMMMACILAPILMACFFSFGVPLLEKFLCAYFNKTQIITPYYILFDIVLSLMTTIMFCFTGVLVILDELDNGSAKYFFVTPLAKTGYLASRILLPTLIAFIYSLVILIFFSLTNMTFLSNLILSFFSVLNAFLCALLVISFSKNKIEGLALIKICGILIIGIPIPYFIHSSVQYFFSFLPSFWIGKYFMMKNNLFLLLAFLISFIFIFLLWKVFNKRKMN